MPSWPIERWISPSISPARVSCHVYSGTAPSRLIVAHEVVTHGGVGAGSRSARRSRTRTFRAWKRSSPPSGA